MIRGSGAFEYGEHFEVSIEQADGGFTAWIERLDHGPVCCGYSISQAAGTHEYPTTDAAIAAAKAAVDAGEVRLRP
jgi:hypothetical protein